MGEVGSGRKWWDTPGYRYILLRLRLAESSGRQRRGAGMPKHPLPVGVGPEAMRCADLGWASF